jgi:hypothetical protein
MNNAKARQFFIEEIKHKPHIYNPSLDSVKRLLNLYDMCLYLPGKTYETLFNKFVYQILEDLNEAARVGHISIRAAFPQHLFPVEDTLAEYVKRLPKKREETKEENKDIILDIKEDNKDI